MGKKKAGGKKEKPAVGKIPFPGLSFWLFHSRIQLSWGYFETYQKIRDLGKKDWELLLIRTWSHFYRVAHIKMAHLCPTTRRIWDGTYTPFGILKGVRQAAFTCATLYLIFLNLYQFIQKLLRTYFYVHCCSMAFWTGYIVMLNAVCIMSDYLFLLVRAML